MPIAIPYSAPSTDPVLSIDRINVSELLRRIGHIMLDDDHVRWTVAELLDWVNDAAREIVQRRPAARAVTARLVLTTGTWQQGPAGCTQVLDVVRNILASGASGRAIRMTDRQQMDDADPDWHDEVPGLTIHYMIDERSPTSFYVYPPALNGAVVEVLAAKAPEKVDSSDDVLDLRDEFMSAVLSWVMYRCHSKDSEFAQGAVAGQHYQAFTDAIGAPAQAAAANSATGKNA